MIKKTCFVSALFILIAANPAHAQNNWLDMAKSVLNSQTSKTGAGTTTGSKVAAGLSNDQISAGLKEALNLSAKKVVAQLGKSGAFNLDPKIHIPLPAPLARVDTGLKAMGMGSLMTDLETRMNKAAEMATPKAQQLFVNAIKKMTVDDARTILSSQQDAATQYLRKSMGEELAVEMKPIINGAMAEAGVIKAYDSITASYPIPMAASAKTGMNDYVTNKAMDGIFYYVAQEEAAIRQNPAKRTTDLLKKVFGAN